MRLRAIRIAHLPADRSVAGGSWWKRTNGVLQSAAIYEFHESDGILIEATSTPPGMSSMVLPGLGAPLMLERAVDDASWRRMHVAAFHPTGTAGMGADAERHPVDEQGRLRGVHGVWVADGFILPTCPEVNPQVTIMALALAVADRAATG